MQALWGNEQELWKYLLNIYNFPLHKFYTESDFTGKGSIIK